MSKKILKLTESQFRNFVMEVIGDILKEGAYDAYPEHQLDIELDSNQNVNNNNISSTWSQNGDPMAMNIKGSTLRDMLNAQSGNNLDDKLTYYDIDPNGQKEVVDKWLNTPNAARNFKEFPRVSKGQPMNSPLQLT